MCEAVDSGALPSDLLRRLNALPKPTNSIDQVIESLSGYHDKEFTFNDALRLYGFITMIKKLINDYAAFAIREIMRDPLINEDGRYIRFMPKAALPFKPYIRIETVKNSLVVGLHFGEAPKIGLRFIGSEEPNDADIELARGLMASDGASLSRSRFRFINNDPTLVALMTYVTRETVMYARMATLRVDGTVNAQFMLKFSFEGFDDLTGDKCNRFRGMTAAKALGILLGDGSVNDSSEAFMIKFTSKCIEMLNALRTLFNLNWGIARKGGAYDVYALNKDAKRLTAELLMVAQELSDPMYRLVWLNEKFRKMLRRMLVVREGGLRLMLCVDKPRSLCHDGQGFYRVTISNKGKRDYVVKAISKHVKYVTGGQIVIPRSEIPTMIRDRLVKIVDYKEG